MSARAQPMVEPLVPWFGGKRNLAKAIVARIEAIPHDLYAEPFVGMGGIFLRRTKAARVEAINDASGDVVNLFRIARHHPDALLDELRWQLVSREDFQRLLRVDPSTLTDVQRAARFVVLQRLRYAGMPRSNSFPTRSTTPKSFEADKLAVLMKDLHCRLSRVTIEHLDFSAFIAGYDREGAFFYIDPPYWGNERDYEQSLFEREDFARLAGLLAGLKGRFLLSINDRPEVREIFSAFPIDTVETTYCIPTGNNKRRVTERLIRSPACR